MTIKETRTDGTLTVSLEGRLDTTTSPELDELLDKYYPSIDQIIFDFEKLDYISSAGLRVLLATQKTMNRQGSMKVKNANEIIMEIFEVTGFADILTIE